MNSMSIIAVVLMFIGFLMISLIGYFVCYFGGKYIGYRRGYNTAKQERFGDTNSDYFKTIYSEEEYTYVERSGNIWVITEDDNCIARFDIDWWNSLYEKE